MKQANHGDSCTEQPKIDRPYLLVTSIPYFLGADGSIWLEQLWHRDLAAHVRYLERLTLAAPCYPKTAESHLVRLDIPSGVMLRLQAIPRMESTLGAVLRFPKTVATLWSAIGQVEIVHSGVAGWPYPIGWVANSIALARRKKLILVVESTPWRLIGSSRHNWKHRLRARVAEPLARFFVDRADLCIFTQPGYRDSLLTQRQQRGHIIPASWIREEDIVEDKIAHDLWNQKGPQSGEDVRFLFAGRLTHGKGLTVLLDAMRQLELEGAQLNLDIIGKGYLRENCIRLADANHVAKISVLDPLPYGRPFFELIRRYHALVVPNLSDEQPRIIFDSYSQAVPVIASDTEGIRPYVKDGKTGRLVVKNDVGALATALRWAISQRGELHMMGMNALEIARSATLRKMHCQRWTLILELLSTL